MKLLKQLRAHGTVREWALDIGCLIVCAALFLATWLLAL